MKLPPGISAALNVVVLAATILAAVLMPETPPNDGSIVDRAVKKFNSMRSVSAGRTRETEGYYEDLFKSSKRSVAVSAVVSGQWAANWTTWEFMSVQDKSMKRRGDFLYFELLPNLDLADIEGRLVTNSFGMADREYDRSRRTGFRRCALIGDSMARGLGSTPGANYESLLEDTLNTSRPNPAYEGYEILNFGVEAYRITQMVEVARTKAAEFSPDCYILVLSDLSVSRKWADHIWQMVADDIDLQYDFLKDVVRRAGIRPGDDAIATETKLEPYRFEVLRWALEEIRNQAAGHNAGLVLFLVPTVEDPATLAVAFQGVHDLARGIGLPTIDLLDTFGGLPDRTPFKINRVRDQHPNDRGHRLLFNRLVSRLAENDEAWSVLTGVGQDTSPGAGR
jgi:hypothetical protein